MGSLFFTELAIHNNNKKKNQKSPSHFLENVFLHSYVSAESFATIIKLFVSQDKVLLEIGIAFAFLLIILITCYLENTVLKLQYLFFSCCLF